MVCTSTGELPLSETSMTVDEFLLCFPENTRKSLSRNIFYPVEADWMPDWCRRHNNNQLKLCDELVRHTEGKIIVDVGCFIGGFTKIMAAYAKEKGGKVFSIDLFNHKDTDILPIITRNMEERGLLNNIHIEKGCSWEYANTFEDNSIDFVFIDADHSYEAVKKDILSYFPKLKIGGIMAGHDYEFKEYNEEYVNEDGHGDRHHGVIKAVNEIFGDVEFSNTIWYVRRNR